ncbi:MAG: tachylectin-related carbohydrate-binding protein [Balneolaceae bacterium]
MKEYYAEDQFEASKIAPTDGWRDGTSLDISPSGVIYTVDGKGLRSFTPTEGHTYIEKTIGKSDGWREIPDIVVDQNENIFLIDGNGLREFRKVNNTYTEIKIGNTDGWRDGASIDIDNNGNIYSIDGKGVRKFSPNSNGTYKETKIGKTDGWREGPDIKVDSNGNVFVIDGRSFRMYKKRGAGYNEIEISKTDGWYDKASLDIDEEGKIYLLDGKGIRVFTENKSGNFREEKIDNINRYHNRVEGGTISVDASGNIFVAQGMTISVYRKTATSYQKTDIAFLHNWRTSPGIHKGEDGITFINQGNGIIRYKEIKANP